MRILIANKYLFRRDGVTSVVEASIRLLRERGHEVSAFGQADPRNFTASLPGACVPPVAFDAERPPLAVAVAAAARMLFSWGARRALSRLLRAERPQVAHLHNIYHHLAPPIIGILKRREIPVVMTLHDYKAFCPNYLLRRGSLPCDLCLSHGPIGVARRRCIRGSAAASLVSWLEAIANRRFYRAVDLFLAPSDFMADIARRAGVPRGKLIVLRNPAPAPEPSPAAPRPDRQPGPPLVLFLGRLHPEKGADVLLDACARLPFGAARLVIAGEGPERPRLEEKARALDLDARFAGFVDGAERDALLASGSIVAFPSLWHENAPMTILEAFAAGAAVVASRAGGIPEMVGHRETGLLVEPGDPDALAGAIRELIEAPDLRRRLGERGREAARSRFSPARHVERLEAIYGRAVSLSPF